MKNLLYKLLLINFIVLGFLLTYWFNTKPKISDVNKKLAETMVKEEISNLPMDIPIIMYHYVEVVKDENDTIRKKLAITPAAFEKQINQLVSKGYVSIYVSEIPKIVKLNDTKSKYIALTFDDGYKDFYTDAFPILKKHNIKSTLYVVPTYVGKGNYINSDDLLNIVKSGIVDIGAHTMHHLDLTSVPLERASKEVVESKKMLEELYGIKVLSFAYPYGFYNNDIIKVVEGADYNSAVSEIPNSIQSTSNLFFLSRLRPGYFYSVVK